MSNNITIADELVNLASRLQTVKTNCNTALANKGVTGVNCLDEIPGAIDSIVTEGNTSEMPPLYATYEWVKRQGLSIKELSLGTATSPFQIGYISDIPQFIFASELTTDFTLTMYVDVISEGFYTHLARAIVEILTDDRIEPSVMTIYAKNRTDTDYIQVDCENTEEDNLVFITGGEQND